MKLAEYKPVIDVQNLPENLREVEDTASAAQRFFQSTRMKVVYYEDLVMTPQVGPSPLPSFSFFHKLPMSIMKLSCSCFGKIATSTCPNNTC